MRRVILAKRGGKRALWHVFQILRGAFNIGYYTRHEYDGSLRRIVVTVDNANHLEPFGLGLCRSVCGPDAFRRLDSQVMACLCVLLWSCGLITPNEQSQQ